MFKEFRSEVEKQLGKSIKALRLDQSEEYLNQEFQSYLRDNKISLMTHLWSDFNEIKIRP